MACWRAPFVSDPQDIKLSSILLDSEENRHLCNEPTQTPLRSGAQQNGGKAVLTRKYQYHLLPPMPDVHTVTIGLCQMHAFVPSVDILVPAKRLLYGLRTTKAGRSARLVWNVVDGLVKSTWGRRWTPFRHCAEAFTGLHLQSQGPDLMMAGPFENGVAPKNGRSALRWLDLRVPFTEVVGPVLKAAQAHAQSQLLLYEVSPLVSNIKNESPDCILPKKEYSAKQLTKGIGRFFKSKTEGAKQPVKEAQETSLQKDTSVVNLD
eukprot:symbB.v1.2.008852.t1/scaffold553.1/size187910/13